ncbi:MAG: T9SS type A sorting domain-containing protein, partial [Candidatus Desantisbacteria bacterium]
VLSDSTHYLRVRTKDNAGNWSDTITLFTIKYDSISPINPVTPCNGWADINKTVSIPNNTWQSTDAAPYFDWTEAMDSGSGIAGYSVYWGISDTGEPGTASIQPSTVYTIIDPVGTQTIHYLRVKTKDNAGNWGTTTTLFTFMYDPTLPTNPTSCIAWTDNTRQATVTSNNWQNLDASPYFEWSGAAASSGIAGYTVYWGTDEKGEPGTGNTQADTNYTVTNVPSNSIYYLRIRTKSINNQWSQPSTIFTLKYDNTLPTGPGTPCNAWADNSKQATLTTNTWQNLDSSPYFEWSGAADIGSGLSGYSVYWGTSSAGEPDTGNIQTDTNYTAISSVPADSTYYLRVRTKDIAGNWSSAVTLFTFKYDSTSPTNPGIPCNGWTDDGRQTSITNNIWQNIDASPYFEWSGAADNSSGIACYSVYWGTSSAGEPGTGNIQTNTNYTATSSVPSDSTYYLRVRTKDNAGNWSSAVTLFTFKYDVTGPVVRIDYPANGSIFTVASQDVSGMITGDIVGTATCMLNGVLNIPISTKTSTFSTTLQLQPGLNNIEIKAQDAAKNIGTHSCIVEFVTNKDVFTPGKTGEVDIPGKMKVELLDNTFTSTVTLIVNEKPPCTDVADAKTITNPQIDIPDMLVNSIYEIKMAAEHDCTRPIDLLPGTKIKISFSYPDNTPPEIISNLKIFLLDETDNKWVLIGGDVDTVNRIISIEADHLSVYRLAVDIPITSSITGICVFPNPFISNESSKITFKGLTENIEIRIFNITGEMVKQVRVSGQNEWQWDVRNNDNEEAASGIYIYLIEYENGAKVKGKIGVIR